MATNKVRSVLLSKNNKMNSPSPDSKRANLIKPTYSPAQEIQKFLFVNKHQVKLKKQISTNKLVPTNQKNQNNGENFREREQNYQHTIQQLEEQVEQYKMYVAEYEELAHKNKKLQEQMSMILQELQSRSIAQENESPLFSPKRRGQNMPTLQSSIEYSPSNKGTSKGKPIIPKSYQNTKLSRVSKDQQIEYLYEYIQNLEGTIQQLVSQSKNFQSQLKKNVKKDMNDMEQRLMNYIFGLQERVSQATFRNNDIVRKLQTFRDNEQLQSQIMRRRSSRKSMIESESNKIFKRKPDDFDESIFKLTVTQGKDSNEINGNFKKESIISFTNLEVSNLAQEKNEQATVKKQRSRQQSQINASNSNKCQKCVQYLQIINQLLQRTKLLQGQLKNYKQSSQQKSSTNPIQLTDSNKNTKNNPYTHTHTHTHLHGHKKKDHKMQDNIIEQSAHQQEQGNHNESIYQRINTLQSHINIIMDSSLASSMSMGQRNSKHSNHENVDDLVIYERSFEKSYPAEKLRKSSSMSSAAENFLKLEKIKEQLINIMQELQNLVHECEAQPKNSIVNELNRKIREQGQYITELQEQVTRLRLEVQQGRTNRERLQKFMKIQVREQEQGSGSPYFRPLIEPISCIDHKATKGKINQILNSIRKFEDELHEEDKKNSGISPNTI